MYIWNIYYLYKVYDIFIDIEISKRQNNFFSHHNNNVNNNIIWMFYDKNIDKCFYITEYPEDIYTTEFIWCHTNKNKQYDSIFNRIDIDKQTLYNMLVYISTC